MQSLDVQEPIFIAILDPSKADSFEMNERFAKDKKGKKRAKNKRKNKEEKRDARKEKTNAQ